MGTSGLCPGSNMNCPAIQIEHLRLDGQGISGVNGIVNGFSQERSGLTDISLVNIQGTALEIGINASNSGPYSNLTISNVGTCIKIDSGVTHTRGIYGLTCTPTVSSQAAILVDGNNSSIEDVVITGGASQDGILIGSIGNAQGNVLFNVSGNGLKNAIELSANASDTTILAVTKSGTGGTVKDDRTGGTTIGDANLSMYILGDPVQENTSGTAATIGYSRFTTSTGLNAATWLVGPGSPGGTCAIGDLFSQTSGTGTTTLWGCGSTTTGAPGSGQWYSIK